MNELIIIPFLLFTLITQGADKILWAKSIIRAQYWTSKQILIPNVPFRYIAGESIRRPDRYANTVLEGNALQFHHEIFIFRVIDLLDKYAEHISMGHRNIFIQISISYPPKYYRILSDGMEINCFIINKNVWKNVVSERTMLVRWTFSANNDGSVESEPGIAKFLVEASREFYNKFARPLTTRNTIDSIVSRWTNI